MIFAVDGAIKKQLSIYLATNKSSLIINLYINRKTQAVKYGRFLIETRQHNVQSFGISDLVTIKKRS